MHLKSLVWLALVSYLCLVTTYIQAQSPTHNVYVLKQTETESSVFAIRVSDGKATALFTVSNTQRGIVPQVFPRDELNALSHYLTTVQHNQWQISELVSQAVVQLIAASPDNQQVAITVVYATCFIPQNRVCFSTTKLIIVDAKTGLQKTILNLGSHNGEFIEADFDRPEVQLKAMEWMPDQKGLITSITYRGYHPDDTIVILPIDGSLPFKIGDGTSWAVSGDGHQITILAHYNSDKISNGFPNTLHVINLDWQTTQYTQSSYVLYPYYISGIIYAGQKVIFQVAIDTQRDQGGGGLGLFDTQTGTYSLALPEQYFRQMQSTPDGSRLIFQNGDDILSEATVKGAVITMEQIITTPVKNWILGSDGDLLIQFNENGDYQLINRQSHQLQEFSISNPMTNLLHYNLIDW
jgi:hypothetical protein